MLNTLSDKLVITANTGWDEPVEICTDVYIEAPNTLTITSTASIHQGLKFVVKPGAQLRLEGGTMTDAGDGYWKGIEVWGDANATQIPNTGQGKLYIGGGATVEFATEAITAFNPNPAGGDVEATACGLVLAFDSHFRNNARSVEYRRYEGQNYGRFDNCDFTIDAGHYGYLFREHVKLNGVRGLQFTNCKFSNDTGASTDASTIYGNNFDIFYVGNAAVGDNVGTSLGGGIVYECNKNLGSNVFDLWVQEGEGITEDQRNALGLATGNTFSQNNGDPEGDFNNQGGFIQYFFYPQVSEEEPLFYSDNSIDKEEADLNECNSGEVGGEVPDEDIESVKNRFFNAKGQYQLYKADYDELIDDGDTPGLLSEVNQAGAGQAGGLINDLLGISPYVSQHVLKAVVDKPTVFDNGMQVDLLEANPEAVRKAGFWLYLEENSSLEEEELLQVQQASLLNTDRDAIEEDLSAAYAAKHRAADLVLAYYLLDSIAYNRDSTLLWLGHKGSLHSLYLKADILLQTGQDEAAETTLSSISETFLLTEKQQQEHNNKLTLFQLLSGQADIFKLDSLEVVALSDIAQLEGLAAQQARNLLDYAYGGYPSSAGQLSRCSFPFDRLRVNVDRCSVFQLIDRQ